MPRIPRRPVATLWRLAYADGRVSCHVYRRRAGLEMRLETAASTILAEPFEIRPKALARVRALKRSLLRRGWKEG